MKTHCVHGHKLENNFFINCKGSRECKTCKMIRKRIYRAMCPWIVVYHNAKSRCNRKKSTGYHRYGGRGIKFLMTMDDIKYLWFQDKAYLLKRPSIDRDDNNGNYEIDNCRFIEYAENSRKSKLGENNYQTKLTEQKVKEIRKLLNDGFRQCDLAEEFDVSRYVIYDIARCKSWKHIL